MTSRNRIAIVGAGPMAVYTLKHLIKSKTPLEISVFEADENAGCGMPYREGMNADYMFCNAFSKEIPPITRRLATWLGAQDDAFLAQWDLGREDIDARDFYPRVLLGAFMKSEFKDLCDAGRSNGHQVTIYTNHRVVDVVPDGGIAKLLIESTSGTPDLESDHVVLATGHVWPKSPKIGGADLVSPWPSSKITRIQPGKIGILGSSLSAIDIIVALGHEHGTFVEAGDRTLWRANDCGEDMQVTMVSHRGIMPEPDFFYTYPYEPLLHINPEAVSAEVERGTKGLLERTFQLLLDELNEADPAYMAALRPGSQSIAGFSEAYFQHREDMGGLRALRETLHVATQSMAEKKTQAYRYALLRGHENFELILEHLESSDWDVFIDKLMPVFGDCYAAIPHVSVRRVLAMFDAGVLNIIPTGMDSDFSQHAAGKVEVETIDGTVVFDALIDARGQAPAALSDLPFPSLVYELSEKAEDLLSPFRLDLDGVHKCSVYCLAMPQLLERHPFSQGLVNCYELAEGVVNDLLREI